MANCGKLGLIAVLGSVFLFPAPAVAKPGDKPGIDGSPPPVVSCWVERPMLPQADQRFHRIGLHIDTHPNNRVMVFAYSDQASGYYPGDARLVGAPDMKLRARSGRGKPRIYIVYVSATTPMGGWSYAVCSVVVPRSRRPQDLEHATGRARAAERDFEKAEGTVPDGYFVLTESTDNTIVADVTITASDPEAAEPSYTGEFTVTRTGDTSLPLTVFLPEPTGSATEGVDYVTLPREVTIPAGLSYATVTVYPTDDPTAEGPESVTLWLANDSDYAVISNYTVASNGDNATVTIADDDNHPPVLFNPGDRTSAPGDTIDSFVFATDPDNQPLTFSATGLPPALSINSSTGEITGTISTSAESGSPYTVTVTVSDGSLSDSESFSWTVRYITMLNPGDQKSIVGEQVNLPIRAWDADGGPLVFSATGLPPALSINSSTGAITGTIAEDADGGSPFTVTVTASHNDHSASQTFTWKVVHVYLVNPGDQRNAVGDEVILPISAVDPDEDALTYSATGLPAGLTINSFGEIRGTIAATADSGSPYTVTITASDGSHSDSETFTWTVVHLLVANPGYHSNYDGDEISLQVQATDHDSPSLTYSATNLPAGLSIDAGTGLISGTLSGTAHENSPYTVTVSASDDGDHTDSQTFVWQVANPISVSNPGNQRNAAGDIGIDLQISASDVQERTLTYSATGLPAGLSIDSGSGLITGIIDASAASAEPYVVTVTAATCDLGELSASQSFLWFVTKVLLDNPGDQRNAVGDTVSLPLTARENGGHTLSFNATGLPPGLTINSTTGVVSGQIANDADSGSPYSVTVTAGYQEGAETVSDSQTFTWTVTHVLVTNPGDQHSAVGDSISLQLTARDKDTSSLTYSATGLPSGLSVNSETGLITGTITLTGQDSALYTVTATASDGSHSDSQTFYWLVTRLQLGNPGDQLDAAGDSVELQLVATGAPSGATLTYSATGLPPSSTGMPPDPLPINPSTGKITGTINSTADANSPYAVTVSVADGRGATHSQTFQWKVEQLILKNPGDQIYVPLESVSLQIEARYNGGSLTYSATGLPLALSIDPQSGLISGIVSPSALNGSPYQVTVTASAAGGMPTKSVTFAMEEKDLKLTFSPDPIKTGYVYDENDAKKGLPRKVVGTGKGDLTKLKNVKLSIEGPDKASFKLGQSKVDETAGTITFEVTGDLWTEKADKGRASSWRG